MGRSIKFCEIALRKAMAFILCLILCFTFIPLLDNEGTTVNASETLKIGDYVQMGTYYGEPILWRCVAFYAVDENGNVDLGDTSDTYKEGYLPLMLSDKILCLKAFDAGGGVTTGSHGRGCDSGYFRQSCGSNCWEDSNIRCWLNSTASAGNVEWTCGNKPDESHVRNKYNEYDTEAGFLTNFTQSERNCMKSVSQYQLLDFKEYDYMGSYGSTYHTYDSGIEDCVTNFDEAYKKKITDTMFLLDVKQVNKVYQNLGRYYRGKPTAECVEHSEYKSSTSNEDLNEENYWKYWLRTPLTDDTVGGSGKSVRYVSSDGYVIDINAYYSNFGVRPAFYLNLSSTDFYSGDGTEDNPYTIEKNESSINVGDYVQMGTYYGEPILWRCVDIDENGPLMLSVKILCLKAFDASGYVRTGSHGRGYDSGSYRQSYGSNCWEDSNIRCWLNSTASAGNVEWTCGNKPDESHVWSKYNEYDKEAGFLTNFTQSEINCMKKVSQYQLLDKYEYDDMSSYGSKYHTYDYNIGNCVTNFNLAYKKKITDTMFLLDVKQVNKVYQNGEELGYSNYYRGKPTAECVEHSEYTSSSLKEENYWYYWLRSPSADSATGTHVRNVNSDGLVSNYYGYSGSGSYACYSTGGVRPAFYLNLSSTSFVSGNGSESTPYVVAKEPTPAAPTITIYYANEKTEQVINSTIEYQVDDGEWKSGNGTNVELLPGTTYKFRVKSTNKADASEKTTIIVPARPATPSITIDYAKETASTLTTHEYSTDNGSTWINCTENMSISNLSGKTIKIRVKATNELYASSAQEIAVEDRQQTPLAPTVSTKTDTTVTLTPVAGCEYKCGEGGTWQDSNMFAGLKAGQSYTFYQRVKATASSFRSNESSTEVTTKYTNIWKTEPVIENVTYGTAITAVGTPAYGSPTVTYEGISGTSYSSASAPTDAGKYRATFTVSETDTYIGLTKSVNFNIDKAEVVEEKTQVSGTLKETSESSTTIVLPETPEGAVFGKVKIDGVDGVSAIIDGSNLTVTVDSDIAGGKNNFTIYIPVTGAKNYKDYTVEVKIDVIHQSVTIDNPVLEGNQISFGLGLTTDKSVNITFVAACFDKSGKIVGLSIDNKLVNNDTTEVSLSYPDVVSENASVCKIIGYDTETLCPMGYAEIEL